MANLPSAPTNNQTSQNSITGQPSGLEMAAQAGEIASGVGALLLVVIAFCALKWAKHQAEAATHANTHAAKQTEASFLLELDRRWESEEMNKSRQKFRLLVEEAKEHVAGNFNHLDFAARLRERCNYCSQKLHKLMKDHPLDYVVIMRMSGFWETMGYLVRHEYISIQKMIDLFGGAVIEFDDAFRTHLNLRAQEEGVPDGLYEHALYLADKVREKLMPQGARR